MYQYEKPTAMDRQLDVLQCHPDGGLLLGASSLTGQYWLGSLWFYSNPDNAPDVDSCTAGVQLEAGVSGAQWVDNTSVCVGLDTGGVAVWRLEDDFRTFVLSQSAAGHDDVVSSLSVNSDSTRAVSASRDRCIKIWDLPSIALVYSAKAHSAAIHCVDCHPSESDLFLSCAQDNRILLWDRRKPKPASILSNGSLSHAATCVRWHPTQTHKFAAGSESGELAMLDMRAGVDTFISTSAHSRPITGLQFCTEKPSLLASISEDCQTVVTSVDEADDMKQIYTDTTHQDFVHGLAWRTTANLYTCGWDSRVLRHNPLEEGGSSSPTVLGQGSQSTAQTKTATTSPSLTNGDIHSHIGEGDGGSSCKVSYSGAVKVSQEVKAEG